MRWFLRRGLRVLMYHRVSPERGDGLTVTTAQLEAQLRWLQAEGFRFVTAAEALRAANDGEHNDGRDAVLVTFDDAYLDTWQLARPVLRALGVPAIIFVPTAWVGQASGWDRDAQPLMDAAQLRAWAGEGFELGLHSHRHVNFQQLDAGQIASDIRENFAALQALGCGFLPALAYPYGARPRHTVALAAMKTALRAEGVQAAFRIGGRINRLPVADPFEINRIGVRGDRPPGAFQHAVRWGRLF